LGTGFDSAASIRTVRHRLDWHPECAAGTAQPPPNVKITGARIAEDEIAAAFEIQGTHKGAGAEIDVYPDGTLGRDRAQ
jgi:hypothetical protein